MCHVTCVTSVAAAPRPLSLSVLGCALFLSLSCCGDQPEVFFFCLTEFDFVFEKEEGKEAFMTCTCSHDPPLRLALFLGLEYFAGFCCFGFFCRKTTGDGASFGTCVSFFFGFFFLTKCCSCSVAGFSLLFPPFFFLTLQMAVEEGFRT